MVLLEDVQGYLSEQLMNADPNLQPYWTAFENLYLGKLWHQLTLKIKEAVTNPEFLAKTDLIILYKNFLLDFEHRINEVSLTQIAFFICAQYHKQDPKLAVEFMQKIAEKVKENTEAKILAHTYIGTVLVKDLNDLPAARKLIEDTQKDLDSLYGIRPVHSNFYQLSSLYYQLTNNYNLYYREALRFLGCSDMATFSDSVLHEWAFTLGIAALLGTDIYNFGELLMHDVVGSLKTTPWLLDLLYAFNSGDIAKFDALRPQWSKQGDLLKAEQKLRDKITLLALMEMAFRRPAIQRQLQFQEIKQLTHCADVELLIMRALSVGLMKGSIDETEQKFCVTWVQPRVLDLTQVSMMQVKVKSWIESVSGVKNLVQVRAHDILN